MRQFIMFCVVCALVLCTGVSFAAKDKYIPEGLTEISGGAYVYSDNGVFVVFTFDPLTDNKSSEAISSNKTTHKVLLPKSKDLMERLLKIEDVQFVKVEYKKVTIGKFLLVRSFESMLPEIEKAFSAVFGKGSK